MAGAPVPDPTDRELQILKSLWELGEGSVRQVHDQLAPSVPIVQNTVQAFLRTMEAKGLVTHRVAGRTFVYRPTLPREQTSRRLVDRLLRRAFDDALDQLVASAFEVRAPSEAEIQKLRALLERAGPEDAAAADPEPAEGHAAEGP